jgi:hypothetical protein
MRFLVSGILISASLAVLAQQPAQPPAMENEKPLSDIVPIMQKVIVNERASEAAQQGYLAHEKVESWEGIGNCWPPAEYPRTEYPQCVGGGWGPVSGESRESEAFWLQNVRVSRLLRVSRSKRLNQIYSHTLQPDELRQENAHRCAVGSSRQGARRG